MDSPAVEASAHRTRAAATETVGVQGVQAPSFSDFGVLALTDMPRFSACRPRT